MPEPAKRQPVDYRHDAIYPEFLQFLAMMAGYAATKYGDPLQYLGSRLDKERGPINHSRNHIGQYQMGEPHDHFGSDPRWQLAAAAYNLMMEFVYVSRGEKPDTWPQQPDPAVEKVKQALAEAEALTANEKPDTWPVPNIYRPKKFKCVGKVTHPGTTTCEVCGQRWSGGWHQAPDCPGYNPPS